MDLDYPFHFDGRDRTAQAGGDAHVRDLIEQVLFTQPGERVNRPDFGSGILQLVFGPASPEMAATTEFLVQAALQRWLADVVLVERVATDVTDSMLTVSIDYVVLRSGEHVSASFERPVAGP
jgi:phage baseplate assembly protein W